MKFEKQITFAKRDADKRIVAGAAFIPNKIDSQGDFMTAETIEAMAHEFIESGRQKNIDVDHDLVPSGSVVIESAILKQKQGDLPAGTWLVAAKVADEVWPLVKEGNINGFSIFGSGQRVEKTLNGKKATEVVNPQVQFISLVKRGAIHSNFTVRKSANMTPEQIKEAVAAGVAAAMESLTKRIDSLETGEPVGVEKAEQTRRAVEIDRLSKKRDHLQGKLEQVWYGEAVENRKAKQDSLLAQIDEVETELAGLRKSDNGIDLSDNPAAFRYRGGRSYRSVAHLNNHTSLGIAKSAEERKNEEDAIDLDKLYI